MTRSGSRGRRLRSFVFEGFEILVGKGDAENDELTFRVARPADFWLHVANVPGSHVVVRNPEGLDALPRAVAQRVAELAVYHSKARTARGKQAVHLCRAGEVRKRPGAPAGEVQLARWDVLKVYPPTTDPFPEG